MTTAERNSLIEHLTMTLTNRESDFYAEEMGQQLFVCVMTNDFSHLNSDMLKAIHEKHHPTA